MILVTQFFSKRSSDFYINVEHLSAFGTFFKQFLTVLFKFDFEK